MNKCPLCKGPLKRKVISYVQPYHGKHYLVENVPALVCQQCGEIILEPDVAKRVQALVWSGKPPSGTVELPVYDLAEAT